MARFRPPFPAMPAPPAPAAPPLCTGCGGKVAAGVLGDAALGADAVRFDPAVAQVHTVDTLTDFMGDPFVFARITGAHAAGDLIVAGTHSNAYLASVGLDDHSPSLQARDLIQLRAGLASLNLGQSLGGHTWISQPASLTLSLQGTDPGSRPQPLAVGDEVWVSRPLGSGLLLRGVMQGQVRGRWLDYWVDRAIGLEYDLMGVAPPKR